MFHYLSHFILRAYCWCQVSVPSLHKVVEVSGMTGGHGPLDGHGHLGAF